MRLLGLSAPAQHGCVVHNHTLAAWLHDLERSTCHAEGAGQRDVNDLAPLVIAHVDNLAAGSHACVVDQHINAAHGLIGFGDQALHLFFLAHIAQLAENLGQTGFLLDLLDGFGQTALMHVGDIQGLAALFCCTFCSGETNAGTGSSGNENSLAFEQAVRSNVGRCASHL